MLKPSVWISFAIAIIFQISFFPGSYAGQEPLVSVRVGEFASEFEFSMPNGGEWHSEKLNGTIPKGTICKVSGKLLNESQRTFHLMIGSCDQSDKKKMDELESKFKASGLDSYQFILKSDRSNLPGKTTIFFGVSNFNEIEKAREAQQNLSEKGISSWIFIETKKLSMGDIHLKIGKKNINGKLKKLTLKPNKNIEIKKVEYAKGFSWHGFENRTFPGSIDVFWGAENKINTVLKIPLEKFIAGIVPSEISAKAPPAALQAQAVAARGEMLSKMGLRHFGEGYDFCTEQHCQVYKGTNPTVEKIASIIKPTSGLVIKANNGRILDAVYGANCGGHSSANHMIWTSNPDPHLQGVFDTVKTSKLDLTDEKQVKSFILHPPACYCSKPGIEGSDKFRWKKVFSKKDLGTLSEELKIGPIKRISDFQRDVSGRIVGLKIYGQNGSKTILKELPIRRLFGMLRSSCFVIDSQIDKTGNLKQLIFHGAGWGHGVGMCQTGAQSMAKLGKSYKEILVHYFPGVSFTSLY